jgi:predicted ATPase
VRGPILSRVGVERRSGYDDGAWYWQLPAIAQLREEGLDLAPVTVLVGANGSGKSTLVEAIAASWKRGLASAVHHWGPDPSREDTDLFRHLSLADTWPRADGGCFLRAESMHGHFAELDNAAQELRAFENRELNARSHGESFLALVDSRLTERGLWVLDEPESALSFRSCLRLLSLLDALRGQGSQVLLATHSPVLAALPGALLLELDEAGMTSREWADLELVRDWQDFLAAPERWLRQPVLILEGTTMAKTLQLTVDCADPGRLTRFWATALDYRIQPPPGGFESWNAYWRSVGVPEEELDDERDASDSLIDPTGAGPRIWFQVVPEGKRGKNRLHLDITVSGGRSVPIETRRQRIEAEAERLVGEGATRMYVGELEGLDHYGVTLQDPEGNEFCLN